MAQDLFTTAIRLLIDFLSSSDHSTLYTMEILCKTLLLCCLGDNGEWESLHVSSTDTVLFLICSDYAGWVGRSWAVSKGAKHAASSCQTMGISHSRNSLGKSHCVFRWGVRRSSMSWLLLKAARLGRAEFAPKLWQASLDLYLWVKAQRWLNQRWPVQCSLDWREMGIKRRKGRLEGQWAGCEMNDTKTNSNKQLFESKNNEDMISWLYNPTLITTVKIM